VLRAYPWPGNVRELQSVLRQALLEARGEVLLPAFLPESLHRPGEPVGYAFALEMFIAERLAAGTRALHAETIAAVERVLLSAVLTHTGGNQLRAAEVLGITRKTLRARLRELGLTITRSVGPVDADE
jgi:two-component system nitrogen regulation response regulator GlnG